MTFIRKIKKGSRVYLAEVKSVREDGKVKQKFIRYVGKEFNGRVVKRISTENIQVDSVKQSLDILVIDKIAEILEIKLIKNPYIISLIYAHLLENKSISATENWIRFTEIPDILGIKKVSVKKLYESLSEIKEEEFNEINNQMFSVFKEYENISDAAVIDVTDTYFSGSNFNIKKRKGKDDHISKLIQIGLAVSFKNGFPIFHKQYHGNLSNVNIYKDMIIELNNKGISSVIFDRGMMSLENLKLSLQLKYNIIAGIKKNSLLIKQFIKPINRDEIYSAKCRINLKNTSVFAKEFDYLNGKLVVIYNPAIEIVKKELSFQKEVESSFDVGYSLIYHNTKYSTDEVVKRYYDKEIVERAFKHLKGVLSLRPIRVWLNNHIDGHIKVCYLAYAILSFLNYKLKKIDISAVEALESLRYGYKVSLKDNSSNTQWSIHVPLEPKQKKILELLNVVVKN